MSPISPPIAPIANRAARPPAPIAASRSFLRRLAHRADQRADDGDADEQRDGGEHERRDVELGASRAPRPSARRRRAGRRSRATRIEVGRRPSMLSPRRLACGGGDRPTAERPAAASAAGSDAEREAGDVARAGPPLEQRRSTRARRRGSARARTRRDQRQRRHLSRAPKSGIELRLTTRRAGRGRRRRRAPRRPRRPRRRRAGRRPGRRAPARRRRRPAAGERDEAQPAERRSSGAPKISRKSMLTTRCRRSAWQERRGERRRPPGRLVEVVGNRRPDRPVGLDERRLAADDVLRAIPHSLPGWGAGRGTRRARRRRPASDVLGGRARARGSLPRA